MEKPPLVYIPIHVYTYMRTRTPIIIIMIIIAVTLMIVTMQKNIRFEEGHTGPHENILNIVKNLPNNPEYKNQRL